MHDATPEVTGETGDERTDREASVARRRTEDAQD
jgi:hypothetical protein